MEQQPITLQFLLEQVGDLPDAKALWEKHVTPIHPELELCEFWDETEDSTTLYLYHSTEYLSLITSWNPESREIYIDAQFKTPESELQTHLFVDEILQTVIFE